jgi:hypothetical protein
MKVSIKALSIAAFAAFVAVPAVADTDVPAVTCGDFAGMDDAAKSSYATNLVAWINDAANASQVESLMQYCDKCENGTPKFMIQEIEGHCSKASADETVVDRLKMPN